MRDPAESVESHQFHFDAASYVSAIAAEVPAYHRLQNAVADASAEGTATRILDLGVGTGETARAVWSRHVGALLVGIDDNTDMLAIAETQLPTADLRRQRLEDPLPFGHFDLIVTALAVHHLTDSHRTDLFVRIAATLSPRGRFVLGDVIVPDDPADAITPLDPVVDLPTTTVRLLDDLAAAGLLATIGWQENDLMVITAEAGPEIQDS